MRLPDNDLPRPDVSGLLRFTGAAADCPHLFNPTLLDTAAGRLCFVRGVTTEGARRVFRCRLNDAMQPVTAAMDWTAELADRPGCPAWIADPRGFRWGERWFISFNTGHASQPNEIHVVEVAADGQPVAGPFPARLTTGRRVIEKNWGFFAVDDHLYAIYSLDPLQILSCTLADGWLRCEPAWRHDWLADPLRTGFGPLHGGTSPCRAAGRLLTVFQSRVRTADGFSYSGNVIELEPEPPFGPVAAGDRPLLELSAEERHLQPPTRLNPRVARCLYPAGLAMGPNPDRLTVSYGINDVASGFRTYPVDALLGQLVPVTRVGGPVAFSSVGSGTAMAAQALRTFHWQPRPAIDGTPEELAAGRFVVGNVGDALQRHVSARLFGLRTLVIEHGGRRLLGAGSIAHRAQAGDVIWGSGFKEVPLQLTSEERASIDVRAVRGPLTADYLVRQGVAVPPGISFCDPGLLVGELFGAEIEACRRRVGPPQGLLLVPHYRHTAEWLGRFVAPGRRLQSVDCDLFEMIRAILAAELVVSSSLHGIILAEAVGVPALLLRPPAAEPLTKYEDYYQGTGRATFPVIDDPVEAARVRPADGPRLPPDWRRSLPTHADLRAHGLTVPILPLDHRVAVPLAPGAASLEAFLELGRFAGGPFTLAAEWPGPGHARLELSTERELVHAVDLVPQGGPVRLDLNGRRIEERGGCLRLSITVATPMAAAELVLAVHNGID